MLYTLKNKIRNKIRGLKKGNLSVNDRCEFFEVDGWALSDFILKKIIPITGVRPFPMGELELMTAAVCRIKLTHIFEWGTHIGKSARIFYEACKLYSPQTEIHSTDLPDTADHEEHPRNKRALLVKNIKAVHLHQGDGLDTSLQILKKAANIAGKTYGVNPLFFIDGDHSYDSVRRELQGIYAAFPQSHILLHDTFLQSKESEYNIGPHEALEEFLTDKRDKYQVIATETGLPGMTLLYRKSVT